MSEIDVLVIGGGPAGIAAACAMAESKRSVVLCDQSSALGGVVHRRRADGNQRITPPRDLKKSWGRLNNRLRHCAAGVDIRLGTIFLGLDSTGLAVLKNHRTNEVVGIRPRMVIFATGAYENVRPVPGWQLPGVVTAGGLQVSMKAAGVAPEGKVLLAGSGPLLLAVAAQLAQCGNAPIAVIEQSNPLRAPWRALRAPAGYLHEAAGYLAILASRQIPWIRDAAIRRINPQKDGLEIAVERHGNTDYLFADIVGLHDGLQPNNVGLPPENFNGEKGILIAHAGDCRELLGARAAPLSGELAARALMAATEGKQPIPACTRLLAAQRRAQAIVGGMFGSGRYLPLTSLPDETILCRCEQKTLGDLRHLLTTEDISARELKLLGRFGMGRCQGRFCRTSTQTLLSELSQAAHPSLDFGRPRWPLRPTSIGALANITSGSADGPPQPIEPFTEKEMR